MFVPVMSSIDQVSTEYIPSTNQVYKHTGQHRIFLNRTDRYALLKRWNVSCNSWTLCDFSIPLKTFTYKFHNVHTRYIHVRKSCTCTYQVHTISKFSYGHVPVHTQYVLVRTFSEGFVQGVRFPDGFGKSNHWLYLIHDFSSLRLVVTNAPWPRRPTVTVTGSVSTSILWIPKISCSRIMAWEPIFSQPQMPRLSRSRRHAAFESKIQGSTMIVVINNSREPEAF
jgi:hypothetical protein